MADFFKGAGGGIIGSAISGVLGMIGANKQFNQQKELMGLQAQYNEQAAIANQERAKEMWEFTNYENQVAHLKNAGLNPALMYGGSGAGGSTSGAGNAQGVGQGSAPNYGEILQQAAGMGLQAAMMKAEIKLKESEAKKNDKEAEKAGADILSIAQGIKESKSRQELIKADVFLKEAETELTKTNKQLQEANITLKDVEMQKTLHEISQITANTNMILEKTREQRVISDVAEKTIETQIQQSFATLKETWSRIMLNSSEGKLTEAQVEATTTGIIQRWREIHINEKDVNARKNKMEKDIEVALKQLKLQNKRFVLDTTMGVLNFLNNVAGNGVKFIDALIPF